MAKQKQGKQAPPPPAKKKPASTSSGLGTYFVRNLAVAAGVAIVFWIFWQMFSKERRLSDLTQEFYKLRATSPNSPQLKDVYDEIMILQPQVIGDTSFFARSLRGYHWAIHDMCLGSLADIEDKEERLHQMHADSTPEAYLEARKSIKIGLYGFIQQIIKSTPPNAVILLPAGDSAMWNNSKWNSIYEPEWMEYFIYPRLCLNTNDEKTRPELAKRVTHVLIVEGKGYDRLKYDVPMNQRVSETILPIDHPPATEAQPVKKENALGF